MSMCKFCQKEADVTPSFCLHKCVCSECLHSKQIFCCVECSYPIYNYTSNKYNIVETIDTFVAPVDPNKVKRFISIVLLLLRGCCAFDGKTTQMFVESLQSAVQDIGDGCMLDKEQCEFLLQSCLNKIQTYSIYMVQNFLVAMCKYPWDIDVRFGGPGVCYNGNLGITPCIVRAASIVRRNMHRIKNENNFFK